MKVWVLQRGFVRGGAERQAAMAAVELKRRGHEVEVVVFHRGSAYLDLLSEVGLVEHVVTDRRWKLPLALWAKMRASRPDAILSFMAGANLLALLGRLMPARPLIAWGVRSTTLRLSDETRLGALVSRIEPVASRWCDVAISNSYAGRDDAVRRGFAPPRFEVVPNGIDLDRFAPENASGTRLREELDVPGEAFLIGRIGRVHPMKDLETLLRSLAQIPTTGAQLPDAHLVVVGTGDQSYVATLRALATELGVARRVHWLGDHDDPASVYRELDLVVSSSAYGEGLSNVIVEALACGVPCVGTDVGDTRLLIDDDRFVAPPEDPRALTAAIRRILEMSPVERATLGQEGRRRIVDRYGAERLGERLEQLLLGLVAEMGDS